MSVVRARRDLDEGSLYKEDGGTDFKINNNVSEFAKGELTENQQHELVLAVRHG